MNRLVIQLPSSFVSEQRSSQSLPVEASPTLHGQAIDLVESLQAELNDLRAQLAWSNRLSQLGVLAAGVAHETNNAMTPVRAYAQLALKHPDDVSLVRRALKAAEAGAMKTVALNERMLALAEPEQRLEAHVCCVRDAAASAVEAMSPLLTQQRVAVDVGEADACVAIESSVLEQVFINLIGNACQAMLRDDSKIGGAIAIGCEAAGDRVRVRVRDNGPGVPERIRERIFEPFVSGKALDGGAGQAADEDDRAGMGIASSRSGLGLSICRRLIERAEGALTLVSSDERGAVFCIELPAADAVSDAL
jgi:signal transduction histidine kinase